MVWKFTLFWQWALCSHILPHKWYILEKKTYSPDHQSYLLLKCRCWTLLDDHNPCGLGGGNLLHEQDSSSPLSPEVVSSVIFCNLAPSLPTPLMFWEADINEDIPPHSVLRCQNTINEMLNCSVKTLQNIVSSFWAWSWLWPECIWWTFSSLS